MSILILAFELTTLLILSFLWSFYFLRKIYNEKRELKYIYSLRGSISEFKWSIKLKNRQIQQIRDRFLLIICMSECTLVLLPLFTFTISPAKQNGATVDFSNWMPQYHLVDLIQEFFTTDISFKIRLALILIVLLSIYMLSRILTEFLCSCYSFYPVQAHNKTKILQSLYILAIILIIGIIPHLELLYLCIYIVCMAYEFLRFAKATKQLRQYLYQRYFDSLTFENHTKSIVNYYKRVYQHFTIGSYLLTASLFLHFLSLTILIFHSILMCILDNPATFPTIIISEGRFTRENSALPDGFRRVLYFYDSIVCLIEPIIFNLGWAFLIIPYLLITIKGISSKVLSIRRGHQPIAINVTNYV